MKRPAAALLLALASAAASAACSREFSVGISELGYGAYQQGGQWQGIVPQLIAELSRRSGCQLKLTARPRARVVQEFEQGQLDMMTSSLQVPERDRIAYFLPYSFTEIDLIVAGDAVPRTLDDWRLRPDLKLGMVRGIRLSHRLNGIVEGMLASRQAELSPDYENLASKLAAGRVQAALIPSVIHIKLRRDGQLPAQAVMVDLAEATTDPLGLYLNRSAATADDVRQLRQQLDAMRREGWVQVLYARYVGEAEAKRLFRTEAH
ncbi:MAG: transporter substrate-binding domain-containing protein [Burkholderiales bacterium]|nr:transporter substrate-binding domain-containing protein [Burkholderiales bacterium]